MIVEDTTVQGEINKLFGRDVDLNLANRYLNNVTSDLKVTLIANKPFVVQDQSNETIFSSIYLNKVWGSEVGNVNPFFSGLGSHDRTIVADYVKEVEIFLKTFEKKPNVVDLGCGDFAVGAHVRDLCHDYIACDVVPELIEFNKEYYAKLSVDFKVLDMVSDELPSGDIVFIRQVLQHLSNNQISKIIPKLLSKFKFIVLTEHLPDAESFQPNFDKTTGADTRLRFDSGVVLPSSTPNDVSD